ncbi:MAG: SDR family oxidoreductase [Hydrogenophaga sp.]|uniref:SDR family NAD(P)-dependent oxidoreductase n=1 Tax=Hydrogenophaga sp. TaxID=1904254 RepID=UPI002ABB420E|nr:SDR family oxidoreductase [Hydrogenophaga sp.]MDZ4280621.1 SDR family oxidoreductase [Hydrogenophaga sp.]
MPTANETRIVAITGAASGIGAATALLLAERGYRVLAVDRSLPQDEVAVAMTRTGVHTHRCDISSEDEVGALFSVIAHEHGPLHGLVNSAGVESRLLLRDMAAAAWDRVLDVNLRGTMLCLREAALLMAPGASVVNVASIAGKRMSYSGDAAYTASKGAVLAFTRHMAFELAGQGIRVNAVCPGPTLTPMIERSLTAEQIDSVTQTVPLGRWVRAHDVAEAIAFLLSPAATMITGSTLDVDGGVLVSNGTPYRAYVAARQVP